MRDRSVLSRNLIKITTKKRKKRGVGGTEIANEGEIRKRGSERGEREKARWVSSEGSFFLCFLCFLFFPPLFLVVKLPVEHGVVGVAA